MATVPERDTLDRDEWRAEVERSLVEITRSRAETVKLVAEAEKLMAERLRIGADKVKAGVEPDLLPRSMIFQAMLATAALLGAGAAIAKLFFP